MKNRVKICRYLLFLWGAVFFWAGGSTIGLAQEAPASGRAAGPVSNPLSVERLLDPAGSLAAGAEGSYVVHARPNKDSACFGTPAAPIDALVLLDTSASAGAPVEGSNLSRSADIVRSLWAQIDQPVYSSGDASVGVRSRLAVMTVDIAVAGIEINVRLPLTDTTAAIESALDSLTTGADSRFAAGIDAAATVLTEAVRPDAAPVLILLLHDSFFALQDEVIAAVERAVAQGIQVFVVGNRFNIPESEQIEADHAQLLVSMPDFFFLDPQPNDLRRLYVLASGSDATVAARGLVVVSELLPSESTQILPESVKGELLSSRSARWRQPLLLHDQETTWSFRFAVGTHAVGDLSVSTAIWGVDCNGFPFQLGRDVQSAGLAPFSPTQTAEMPSSHGGIVPLDPTENQEPRPHKRGEEQPQQESTREWIGWLIPVALFLSVLTWWGLRNRRGSSSRPSRPASPPLSPPPPPSDLSKELLPGAKTVLPGQRAQDTVELREALFRTQEIRGRIVADRTGQQPLRIVPNWLTHSYGLSNQLPLEFFGDHFLWDRTSGCVEIPTHLLLEVVHHRLAEDTPVLALYTAPCSQIEIWARVEPTDQTLVARCGIRSLFTAQASLQRYHWVILHFVDNPQRRRLEYAPVMEN